jgi:hypothetical protein
MRADAILAGTVGFRSVCKKFAPEEKRVATVAEDFTFVIFHWKKSGKQFSPMKNDKCKMTDVKFSATMARML